MTADLALIAQDPSVLEQAADPDVFIVQACDRARTWLREALDKGDIEQIAELKSQAEAVRIYTISKQYGEDARVSATEIVRRAERGIGTAVRRGQEDRSIRPPQSHEGNQYTAGLDIDNNQTNPASPGKYAGYGQERTDIYAMTDGVSDKAFEEVLTEAKREGNLSRSNVARKAKAKASGSPSPSSPRTSGVGRPQRGRSTRQPLPAFARKAGWALRKDIERIERIFADDRLSQNKDQVAAELSGHLAYAVQACQGLLNRIGETMPTDANETDTTGG